MAELEKVIKCLELCRKFTISCEGCPYENVPAVENCMLTMHCDALELLKEQEHKDRMYHALEDDWKRLKELLKEQKETIENREQEIRDKNERLKERAEQVDSLLKEQEAVAPILIREGRNNNYNDYVCPRCGNEVVYEQNYCSECGVRFLWECR